MHDLHLHAWQVRILNSNVNGFNLTLFQKNGRPWGYQPPHSWQNNFYKTHAGSVSYWYDMSTCMRLMIVFASMGTTAKFCDIKCSSAYRIASKQDEETWTRTVCPGETSGGLWKRRWPAEGAPEASQGKVEAFVYLLEQTSPIFTPIKKNKLWPP